MRKYETMFVLKTDLAEDAIKGIIERVKAAIEKAGEVESIEEWGKRKLAYLIDKKYTEGYYVLINFSAENEVLLELEHNFKINENFIRHMIINKEN